MELKIVTPMEQVTLPEVRWNYVELKAEMATRVAEFNNIAYTAKEAKDMKQDRANINKLIAAFEDTRKQYKKFYMAPYEKFEKEIKEVLEPAVDAEKLLAGKIKEVEEQRRLEKKDQLLEYYEEHIGTLKGILSFYRILKPEYLNASRSLKGIQEEMSAAMDQVNKDLDTIEDFGSKYELQIKDVYIRTFDLSAAMREKSRLEDVEKQLAERKERERQAREARQLQAAEQVMEKPVRTEQPEVPAKREVSIPEQNPVVDMKPEEPLHTIDFRITATKSDIMAVRAFMENYGIQYGPVPKEGA